MLDFTPTIEQETLTHLGLMRALADAIRGGDPVAKYWALDELESSALHIMSPAIRARALREVARHGFVAIHLPTED